MIRRVVIWLLLLAPLCAWGQADERPHPTASAATVQPWGVAEKQWRIFRLLLTNPTDAAIQATVATSFDIDDTKQFVVQGWLPARSQRLLWFPARLDVFPAPVDKTMAGREGIATESVLLDSTTSPERQLSRANGLVMQEQPGVLTGFMGDTDTEDTENAVVAMRMAQDPPLTKSLKYASRNDLPPIAAGWDGTAGMVLAQRSPNMDGAQIEAMKQWLTSGGKLWVMADRVSPAFMRQLLGDDWTLDIVDRVDLQNFSFVDTREHVAAGAAGASTEKHQADPPVDMVRVLASQMEVVHTVNGWPASLRKKVGLGEILITTVGARGWMTGPKQDKAGEALAGLGLDFLTPWKNPSLPSAVLKDYVDSQIGRQTVSRNSVLAILGTLTAAMLLAGLISARRGRLEYAAFIGIIFSVAASAALLGMGLSKQKAVNLTVASVEVGDVLPHLQQMVVAGDLAIYSPTADEGPLQGTKGGLLWPDFEAQAGKLIRLNWQDIDRWQWQHLVLPQGAILPAHFSNVVRLNQPIHALAVYTDSGLKATVTPGPFKKIEDVLILAAAGKMAPKAQSAKDYSAGEDEVLPPEQYIGGDVLSGAQIDRAAVYKSVLKEMPPPASPVFYGWTNNYDVGIQLAERSAAEHKETLLFSVPLEISHAALGQKIFVPTAMIPFEALNEIGMASNRHLGNATVYSPASREWIATNVGSNLVLRFTLPREVVPLKITQATFTLGMDSPERSVAVSTRQAGESKIIKTMADGLLGEISIPISGSDLFQPDDDGTVSIGLQIGDAANPDKTWLIKKVSLSVRGEAEAPGAELPIRLHPNHTFVPQAAAPVAQPFTPKLKPHPQQKPEAVDKKKK